MIKTVALLLITIGLCAGCKPVSALPDPGITVTTISPIPGR